MRKIFILLAMGVALFGAELKWQKDIKIAIEKSQTDKKPLMVVVVKDNCKWCDKFHNETLKSKPISDVLAKDFIIYMGNQERAGEVPPSLITGGTPTTWFLKDSTIMFEPLMGSVDIDDFSEVLKVVKQEYKEAK